MSSHSRRGSILVFSLIILSFMLVSALSIAAVSVTERRSASTTDKSTRSFQVADTGVEKVLQKIYKGSYATPSDLATAVGGSCTNGVISATTTSGSFTVSLYDNSNTQIACADASWRDNATKLRSEGASGNTTRAVEVAVAAVNTCGCWKPSNDCNPTDNEPSNRTIGPSARTSCAGCLVGTRFSGVCSILSWGWDVPGHGAEGYTNSDVSSCNMVAC